MKYTSLEEFIDVQAELLKLEQDAEIQERQELYERCSGKDLERRGVSVRHLMIDHQRTGMYGRFLVKFIVRSATSKNQENEETRKSEISTHKLTPGDIIGLYPNRSINNEPLSTGVVSSVKRDSISIAFNEDFDTSVCRAYKVIKLTNDVTYRRLQKALSSLRRAQTSAAPCIGIINHLFPCCFAAETAQGNNFKGDKYYNERLDESQKNAVQFVLTTSHPISVIHGPPGTGKSTTVIEVIQQAVKNHSMKVLVCAPSNIAVDNLVERLEKTSLNVVRLGHPARVLKEVQKLSLDAILTNRDSSDIIKSVRTDISAAVEKFKKCKSGPQFFALKREVKDLRKDLIERESKAMKEVLANADVILSTTTSASGEGPLKHLSRNHFGLLIIDEAAQAMEISCWIPLLSVSRCIMAGDHKQLPPTIISKKAAKKGLEVTLLERVVKGIGKNVVCMLTTQYRMNKKIMCWPSRELYHDKLIAAPHVANHLLCQLDGVKETPETREPVIFVDTAGCGMHELWANEEQSKGNEYEVDIIAGHIDVLIDAGVKMVDIGVITPYNLQVDFLRKCIHSKYPRIEIHSVDGFQGREKEAILISMVRSNDAGEVGFLAEDRRINVAITRARRHLFVVADSFTISKHAFLASLCSYMQEHCDVRSAQLQNDFTLAPTSVKASEQFELPNEMLNKTRTARTSGEVMSMDEDKGNNVLHRREKAKMTHLETSEKKILSSAISVDRDDRANLKNTQENFTDKIESFIKSKDKVLSFPSNLSSHDRQVVHEIAEKFQLNHTSEGHGSSRKIVVSKTTVNIEAEEPVIPVAHTKCHICSTIVPNRNFDLHVIRCEKTKTFSAQSTNDMPTKKKKKRKSKQSDNNQDEEDIDALLETFSKINSKCTYQKCKASILTVGQKCDYCQQMFCLSHHMAEIHGCGKAAKIKARQDISKHHGSKPQPMNDVKKCQLHRKLNNKLGDMENERVKKERDKKK